MTYWWLIVALVIIALAVDAIFYINWWSHVDTESKDVPRRRLRRRRA